MRIISKYKDYYDSASGYGVDMGIVYSREERQLDRENEADRKLYYEIKEACDKVTKDDRFQNMYLNANYDMIYVGVAGKIYVGLRFHTLANDKDNTLFKVHQNSRIVGNENIPMNQLFAWAPSNLNDKQLDTPASTNTWTQSEQNTPRSWFEKNAAVRIVEDVELFARNEMVSFIKIGHHRGYYHRHIGSRDDSPIILNPCLLNYGFQKMVDSFTIFQEISMFVTGVLAQKDQMTHTATDKELLYARGHDDKSFKTPPTKKR